MPANKMNGQTALKKTFQVGGTIHVTGPDFKGMIARGEQVMVEECHIELNVQVENSEERRLAEITPWFNFCESDVEIAVEYPDDLSPEYDSLPISFKGAAGRSLEIDITSDQARALNEILTSYIRSCDSWKELKKVYPVLATA